MRDTMHPFRPFGTLRSYDPLHALQLVRGNGPHVWDGHGRRFLDMICGYSACNLGHSHPRLVSAAVEQLQVLAFANGGESPWRDALESRLAGLWRSYQAAQSPGDGASDVKVWLSTTGARGVELAWRVAAAVRPGGVARFDLGYHGRSIGSAMISDTARSNALDEACLHTVVIPFPRHGVAADGGASVCSGEDCCVCDEALGVAKKQLSQQADRLSMLIVEPAIGARGYWFASVHYYRRLIAFAKQLGLVVVSDEIQMGLGRLGPLLVGIDDLWAPDLVVLGKSLGGGMVPISAVLGPGDWMDRLPAAIESETFAATPLACRIASEVLSVMEEEVMEEEVMDAGMRDAGSRGNEHGVMEELQNGGRSSGGCAPGPSPAISAGTFPKEHRAMARRHDALAQKGDAFRGLLRDNMPECIRIEGRGMASVLSFDAFGDRGVDVAKRFTAKLCDLGILVHLTGPRRDRLALIPPLNIPHDVLLDSVHLFAAASRDTLR